MCHAYLLETGKLFGVAFGKDGAESACRLAERLQWRVFFRLVPRPSRVKRWKLYDHRIRRGPIAFLDLNFPGLGDVHAAKSIGDRLYVGGVFLHLVRVGDVKVLE